MNQVLPISLLCIAVLVASGCSTNPKDAPGPSPADQRLNAIKATTELELALTAFEAGELDKASSRAQHALRLNPSSADAQLLLARVRLERGDLGGALTAAQSAIELQPKSARAHYVLAMIFERDRNLPAAYRHFIAASRLAPSDPLLIIAAAETLVDAGRPSWARTMLLRSPIAEHDAGIRQLLAHIAYLEGQPDQAVLLLTEARLMSPDDTGLAEDLASALIAAGRHADAAKILQELLAIDVYQQRGDLAHEYARALRSARKFGEARVAYLDAIEKSGQQADATLWAGLGETAFLANDLASVRRAASKLVSLSPDSPDGYVLWALWHWSSSNQTAARRSIEVGLTMVPGDADLETLSTLIDKQHSPLIQNRDQRRPYRTASTGDNEE